MSDRYVGKPSSEGRFFGRSTIYGIDGIHRTPYMTRIWFGRLRLHIFYRGDADPDPHDHPWGFWTFPFTSYVEEVTEPPRIMSEGGFHGTYPTVVQIVPSYRFTHRPATHTHRVLGRWTGGYAPSGEPEWHGPQARKKIVTLVYREATSRRWGFLKHRDGKWCWVHWKEYVFGGGKDAPCQ